MFSRSTASGETGVFSGIVQAQGTVVENSEHGAFVVECELFQERPPQLGDSICVSGVCLTVTAVSNSKASFDLASETRRQTKLGVLKGGDFVNIEPSLRLGDPLHGHLVFGHVDAVTRVISVKQEDAQTVRVIFELPQALAPFVATKGSISIDGVSLTVGQMTPDTFSVYVVPHTLAMTTLRHIQNATPVNIEVDMLARYAVRVLEYQR